MTSNEKKATLSLASIFAFRMLGLFMILPVFSLYAQKLSGTTPALIGLALGIYGLSQALLQIPFGILSDKFGRKPIILAGLTLFALGSLTAALSDSIVGVIIGRTLQGSGAIGSVLIACTADLTTEKNRTKAMAIIGMVIGASFFLAMILGPLFNTWIGVKGIFWFTTALALLGMLILYYAVPTPKQLSQTMATGKLLGATLSNPDLLRLDFGIFIQHAIFTALFVVLPVLLGNSLNLPQNKLWLFYLPIIILAFITMAPFILLGEKKHYSKAIFLGAIASLGISLLLLWQFHENIWQIFIILVVFFTSFSLLEANLPALVSKLAPANSKGTALGIYSSSQFLGIFFGGTLGGWLYKHHYLTEVFSVSAVLAFLWLAIALTEQLFGEKQATQLNN